MEDTLQIRNVTLTMYAGTLNKISEAIGGMSGLDKLAYSDEVKNKLVSTICKKCMTNGRIQRKMDTINNKGKIMK